MNKQTQPAQDAKGSVAEAGSVKWLPVSDLAVSPLNRRSVIDEDAIATLAANIRERGLIQNLAGLRTPDGRVEIVAGGRRLRALALLQDDPRFRHVPVKVTDDEQVGKAWAASENHLREGLHPADEIAENGAMAADGIPVPAIALAFGVSEAHVYRRLKLADLPEPVLSALRADEITLRMAACFTLCEDEAHGVAILKQVRGEAVSEHMLKRLLKPDSVKSTDRRARFVGEDAYAAAGGRLTRDLFAEETLYDDPGILAQVFAELLEQRARELQDAEGWKWVEVCPEPYVGWHQIEERKAARVYPEPGTFNDEEAERYDALAEAAETGGLDATAEAELAELQAILDGTYSDVQTALSGALVYVDHAGDLAICGGLVAKEDRAAAEAAGILPPSHHVPSGEPKPVFSGKLQADLDRIATGARQPAVLDHPDLLLDLLAFQLSGRMGYRRAFCMRTEDVPNMPERSEGYNIDARLCDPVASPKDPWGSDLARAFRAFRKKGRKAMRADLVKRLAALVSIEDDKLRALIDKEVKTDIRAVWTPTAEGFFTRVKGGYLDDLHRDLLDLKPEHPTVTTFAKLKKGEKAKRLEQLFGDAEYRTACALSEAQRTRIDTWLPEEMG